MITTTLNRISKLGLELSVMDVLLFRLNKTEADDEPLLFSVVLECVGLDYAMRCTRSEPEYNKKWRMNEYSWVVVNVAEQYILGRVTDANAATAAALAAITHEHAVTENDASIALASAAALAALAAYTACVTAANITEPSTVMRLTSNAALDAGASRDGYYAEFLRITSGENDESERSQEASTLVQGEVRS